MVRPSPDSLLIQINLKSPAVQIASKSSTVGGSGQPWSAYVIHPEHNKKKCLAKLDPLAGSEDHCRSRSMLDSKVENQCVILKWSIIEEWYLDS